MRVVYHGCCGMPECRDISLGRPVRGRAPEGVGVAEESPGGEGCIIMLVPTSRVVSESVVTDGSGGLSDGFAGAGAGGGVVTVSDEVVSDSVPLRVGIGVAGSEAVPLVAVLPGSAGTSEVGGRGSVEGRLVIGNGGLSAGVVVGIDGPSVRELKRVSVGVGSASIELVAAS